MYTFNYNNKEYKLNEENLRYILQDDEQKLEGLSLEKICVLLNDSKEVEFSKEFYSSKCDLCNYSDENQNKYFPFLEYHFFAFTKGNQIVTTSISKDYEKNSFSRLLRLGKVDNSFLISIIICINCGKFDIEVEQCDM